MKICNSDGVATKSFGFKEDIVIRLNYEVKRRIENLNFGFTIRDVNKSLIFMSQKRDDANLLYNEIGKHSFELKIKSPALLSGTYLLSGELWDNDATFFTGYLNKREITIRHENYMGSGILYFDYEFDNE